MSTYHHGDLRPALLRAAAKILEKEGTGALSLRDLARRAGVSHNAPYRHFPDRDALLAALAGEGFELLGRQLDGKPGGEMAVAYVRFALDHPQRFRLMFGGRLPHERHPELRQHAQAMHLKAEEAFSGHDSETKFAAAAAWSLVHGLAHLLLDGHFAEVQEEIFVKKTLGAVRFAVGPQRSV